MTIEVKKAPLWARIGGAALGVLGLCFSVYISGLTVRFIIWLFMAGYNTFRN